MNVPTTTPKCGPPPWAIGILATFAIVVLYHGAFRVLPAGDDWQPPLSEIYRARATGLWSIVTHNAWQHPAWRPLQSLAFVGLDKLPGDLFAWVSALNLACAIVAIVTLLLWSRAIGLTPVATLAAALAFAAHPINAAAISSNDGFGSILAPAVAWLMAWVIHRLRDRPWLALLIVVPTYAIASGVKEYVFALVPMACAVTLLTYRRPVRWTLIVGAILSVETVGLLAIRRLLVPLRVMGNEIAPGPIAMVRRGVANTAMGVGAALTPSNTVDVFTTSGPLRFVALALGASLAATIVGVATILLLRRRSRDPNPRDPSDAIPPARSLSLVALLTLGSLFPANVAIRMSEMYLLGLGLGVALLIGIAVREAMLTTSRGVRASLIAGVAVWIAWGATSTLQKVDETRHSGELSFALGTFLGDTLPRRAGLRVAVLYDDAAVRRAGYYSVFRVPRSGLVVNETIQYFRPDAPGRLTNVRIGSPTETPPDFGAFDAIVAWDVETWTGHYVKR